MLTPELSRWHKEWVCALILHSDIEPHLSLTEAFPLQGYISITESTPNSGLSYCFAPGRAGSHRSHSPGVGTPHLMEESQRDFHMTLLSQGCIGSPQHCMCAARPCASLPRLRTCLIKPVLRESFTQLINPPLHLYFLINQCQGLILN